MDIIPDDSTASIQEKKPNHKVDVGKNGLPLDVIHNSSDSNGSVEEIYTNDEENNFIDKNPNEDSTINHNEDSSKLSDTVIGKTNLFGTVLNLLNSNLGAGILGVPNTFVNTGILFSLILLLIMAFLSLVATDLLLFLQQETGSIGLGELTQDILGHIGSRVLTLLNLIFSKTALVAYLVLAADMLTSFFELGGLDVTPLGWRALMVLIYALLLPIALSFPRNLAFLRYFSGTTVFCIFFFCIAMLYKMSDFIIKNEHKINKTCTLAKVDITLFASLSIYSLTFSFPSVILTVIRSYVNDFKKRANASLIALIICVFFVVLPGLTGYLIFGDATDPNILKNFEADDVLIIICRAAFFIIVTCAYPMVTQTSQSMWSSLIFSDDSPSTLPTKKRVLILFLTNSIPLLIAMFLPSVKPALSIGGALGGCLVDFVFPCILYLKLHYGERPLYYWKNVLLIIFAIFGVVAAVIATYQAIVDAIDAFSS